MMTLVKLMHFEIEALSTLCLHVLYMSRLAFNRTRCKKQADAFDLIDLIISKKKPWLGQETEES